jgi:vancomycin permeability regulator SanA
MSAKRLRTPLARAAFRVLMLVLLVLLTGIGLLVGDGLRDELGKADAGLVFGNTVNADGTPSARLAARLDRALQLYRDGMFPLIIVSGAVGKEGHDEGVVMRDYLVARGVPSAAVIVDSKGVNTMATAVNTRVILGERQLRSVLLFTQYFHVSRAKLALHRAGVPEVYSAHAAFFEWRDFYSIPREMAGFIAYYVNRGQ